MRASEGLKMYKHVLVAVDGSETSNSALKEAIELAKDQLSMLRLFHVVDMTMAYSSVEAPYVFEYRKAMEAAGQKVVADCSASTRAAGIEFDSKCVVTFVKHIYDIIEEEATSWPADLIVIGTHGRRGMRRLLLGSVAEGLIRISSKPVLLIRGTQEHG
jgi:nucleotide-binding universal stress UspA family protein